MKMKKKILSNSKENEESEKNPLLNVLLKKRSF